MEFEWDSEKADSNLRKHFVSFEDAAQVFLDPNRIEAFDARADYGEDRWVTIGLVEPALLVVVYATRGEEVETVRIISARKADKDERAQYRQIQD